MSLPHRADLLETVGGWSELVDRAIAAGVSEQLPAIGTWSPYEWRQSLDELLKLSSGKDAYYDRPTIGPAYAIWYHARRVNPLVSQLERIVRGVANQGFREVDVVDLGAGTGAVAWAAALVAGAIHEHGGDPPRIRVHEVESSPLMTATADSLWAALGTELEAYGSVERNVQAVSWPNARLSSNSPTWLLASFLLDHTDKYRAEEMARSLHRVVDRCEAHGVVFTVSSSKRYIADEAIRHLEIAHRWNGQRRNASMVWRGSMHYTTEVRRTMYEAVGLGNAPELARHPTFDGDRGVSVREAQRPGGQSGALFSDKSWLALTEEQQSAVTETDRSMLVLGAAGSGKSVVLIESVARVLERRPVGLPRCILITTFNIDMGRQLDHWLSDRLTFGKIRHQRQADDGYVIYRDVGAGGDEIHILNWDKAPTRLASITGGPVAGDSTWLHLARIEIDRLLSHNEAFARLREDVRATDPMFHLSELKRVIYGLEATTWDGYRSVDRVGRGVRIGPLQREFVWAVTSAMPRHFVNRRIEMLDRATSHKLERRFTDVVVDEVQDFLPADITCLLAMLNPREGRALYVGDETQALHVGLSYSRPQPPEGDWRRGRIVRLEGSHRLPIPIARCVRPLAEAARQRRREVGRHDDDISLPESRKAAVIGIRPIVIVDELNRIADQIRTICATYASYLKAEVGSEQVTICEKDAELAAALNGLKIESTTVRKIKGLERAMVVWSARRQLGAPAEALEFAYTVLTRASCLLVIAVVPDELPPEHLEVMRLLDAGQVMLWDDAAEEWWAQCVDSDPKRAALPEPERARTPRRPRKLGIAKPILSAPSKSSQRHWDDGEACTRHQLAWCTLCKPRPLPAVVFSTRGRSAAFHENNNCPALLSGQAMLERAGGSPAPIEAIALETAIGLGRFPCLICLPSVRGRL